MDDGAKVLLVIGMIVIVSAGFYMIINQKESFETFPESNEIQPDSRLGKHILSDEFWDDLNLSQEIRENLSKSEVKIFGINNVTGYDVYTWYRILYLKHNWFVLEL